MKIKIAALRNQLQSNKIKFKKTSTEWTLEYVVKSFKEEVSFPIIIEFAKLAIIVPVTNAWRERGASTVKRIKSTQRSSMKNDLLNALLHISMNGPAANSLEAEQLINRVVERYIDQNPCKVPQIYTPKQIKNAVSTQTEVMDIDEDKDDFITYMDRMEEQSCDFLTTNFDSDDDEYCSCDTDDEYMVKSSDIDVHD